jgi:hypothetical protein
MAYAGVAHGQSGAGDRSGDFVALTMAYVQQCVQADELLRTTCARIGPHLSDRNKDKCALPPVTFEARTARSYRAFKENYRTQIAENEVKIAKLLKKTGDAFNQQFAQVRAGKVSMPDLESLSGELRDRCVTVEREWLAPNRQAR